MSYNIPHVHTPLRCIRRRSGRRLCHTADSVSPPKKKRRTVYKLYYLQRPLLKHPPSAHVNFPCGGQKLRRRKYFPGLLEQRKALYKIPSNMFTFAKRWQTSGLVVRQNLQSDVVNTSIVSIGSPVWLTLPQRQHILDQRQHVQLSYDVKVKTL